MEGYSCSLASVLQGGSVCVDGGIFLKFGLCFTVGVGVDGGIFMKFGLYFTGSVGVDGGIFM